MIAANEGNVPEDKFQKILQAFKDDNISDVDKNGIIIYALYKLMQPYHQALFQKLRPASQPG